MHNLSSVNTLLGKNNAHVPDLFLHSGRQLLKVTEVVVQELEVLRLVKGAAENVSRDVNLR